MQILKFTRKNNISITDKVGEFSLYSISSTFSFSRYKKTDIQNYVRYAGSVNIGQIELISSEGQGQIQTFFFA